MLALWAFADFEFIGAVSLGRNRGTGQAGNFKVWSFIVWYMKSRYLGTNNSQDYIAGKRTVSKTDW